jgi:hypothetical protein
MQVFQFAGKAEVEGVVFSYYCSLNCREHFGKTVMIGQSSLMVNPEMIFFYIFSSERVRLKFLLINLVSPILVRKFYEVARKALYFSVQPSWLALRVLFPKQYSISCWIGAGGEEVSPQGILP